MARSSAGEGADGAPRKTVRFSHRSTCAGVNPRWPGERAGYERAHGRNVAPRPAVVEGTRQPAHRRRRPGRTGARATAALHALVGKLPAFSGDAAAAGRRKGRTTHEWAAHGLAPATMLLHRGAAPRPAAHALDLGDLGGGRGGPSPPLKPLLQVGGGSLGGRPRHAHPDHRPGPQDMCRRWPKRNLGGSDSKLRYRPTARAHRFPVFGVGPRCR
jgi:hypothetical protein